MIVSGTGHRFSKLSLTPKFYSLVLTQIFVVLSKAEKRVAIGTSAIHVLKRVFCISLQEITQYLILNLPPGTNLQLSTSCILAYYGEIVDPSSNPSRCSCRFIGYRRVV